MGGAVPLHLYTFVAWKGTTLYRKCEGSMKIRPTARTSVSRKSHRSDSTPGPQLTSRRRPSHTGFRRQQGVKRKVFFASPPSHQVFSLAAHVILCDVTTFSQERDCISVSKFVDKGEVFASNDRENVTISCTVALRSAVLSEVNKLSYCQSRMTSDGHSVTQPTGHAPATKSGWLFVG